MRLLGKAWVYTKEMMENRELQKAKQREIRKFEDPARTEIYTKIELTAEQKDAIDKLFAENYGQKIPHTWHRHFTAFTGRFDVNYFPELLYIPGFERIMNLKTEYCKVLSDKNMLPLIAASAGVQMPKPLFSCTSGLYRDGQYNRISREQALRALENPGECFAKPSVDSGSGKNVLFLDMRNGVDQRSGRTAEQILSSIGRDFVVQERVKCHKSIASIYDGSLNSFRVITYRWRDEIRRMPVILRIGHGGAYLDNAHAGGMYIAVNDDGTLHEKAFTEFKQEYSVHPDSGLVFLNHQIENFPRILDRAVKMHEAVPQVGCVNWDFTLDQDGNPMLIEANTLGGSIWLIQSAHGRSVFGPHTAEVLRWLRAAENAPKDQLHRFCYGYTDKE